MGAVYWELVKIVRELLAPLLEGKAAVVTATVLTYLTFILLSATSSLAVDKRKLTRLQEEVRRWEDRRRKAIEARDKKMYDRVMREKSRVERLKGELERERLKSTMVRFALWLLLFKILSDSIGFNRPIALFPLPTGYIRIPFYAWFMVNSFWAQPLLSRAWSLLKRLSS